MRLSSMMIKKTKEKVFFPENSFFLLKKNKWTGPSTIIIKSRYGNTFHLEDDDDDDDKFQNKLLFKQKKKGQATLIYWFVDAKTFVWLILNELSSI